MVQNPRIKNRRFCNKCMPVVYGPNGISLSHKLGVKGWSHGFKYNTDEATTIFPYKEYNNQALVVRN